MYQMDATWSLLSLYEEPQQSWTKGKISENDIYVFLIYYITCSVSFIINLLPPGPGPSNF